MSLENWFLKGRDALAAQGRQAVEEAINTPANPIATNPTPIQRPSGDAVLSKITSDLNVSLIIGVIAFVILSMFIFKGAK